MAKALVPVVLGFLASASLVFGQVPDSLPAPRTMPKSQGGQQTDMIKDEAAAPSPPAMGNAMLPPLDGSPEESPLIGFNTGHHVWFSAEYLVWWTKDASVPILVTSGTSTSLGLLGQNGTRTLFGGGEIEEEPRSGGRFTGGFWLDDCHKCGLETTFFFLGDRSSDISFGPDVAPVLARPFFDLRTGAQNAEVASFPPVANGTITVATPSSLWGAEANFIKKLCCGCGYQVNWLGGLRYLDMRDSVNINESLTFNSNPAAFPPQFANLVRFAGDNVTVTDHFEARNQFYGGQAGINADFGSGPWSLQIRGKLGLGTTHEEIDIHGSQVITPPGGQPTVFNGGLLALASNSGHFIHDEFAVVPEINVNGGYWLNEHVGLFLGYNFLYWSRVMRAGDQIDTVIDSAQIPNFNSTPSTSPSLGRPTVPFKQTDYWAQGVNFGVQFQW